MARVTTKPVDKIPKQPTLLADAVNSPAILAGGSLFKIDRAIWADGFSIAAGWCSKGLEIEGDSLEKIVFYRRLDAEAQLGESVIGFVLAAEADENVSHLELKLTEHDAPYDLRIPLQRDVQSVANAINEQGARLATLIDPLVRSKKWAAIFSKMVSEDITTASAAGSIDNAILASGIGGMAQGWIYAKEHCDLWLVSGESNWRSLADSIRFYRPDIVQAFPEDHAYTQEAGFVSSLIGDIAANEKLRLVAVTPDGVWQVTTGGWKLGARDPKEFARQIFDFPTPHGEFIKRLEHHDGPILAELIAASVPQFEPDPIEICLGEVSEPLASIIVPLYGRADFIQHQLMKFSTDPDFVDRKLDLIYVIDDVRLIEYVRANVHLWSDLYRVPFRVVWGGRNRGFSGANNFGAQFAKSNILIFLNSDVFPMKSGWASAMANELMNQNDVAVVGARLDYPDGSIQHIGMAFEWSDDLDLWLNTHPRQGLVMPRGADGERIEVPAATGACLGVRRDDYESVGGFDESYLIGDFEDSDLCLKLCQDGRRCIVLGDTHLVHLVRQSFIGTGEASYRQRVVFFNAWLHSRRWDEVIQEINNNLTVEHV